LLVVSVENSVLSLDASTVTVSRGAASAFGGDHAQTAALAQTTNAAAVSW
jgi:pyrimidine deaminase RibD-like protein